ncbi:MAG: NAD(P)-dependent alcohol dehydrogenase [Alphaproteobacteria bacterium]|nr:NAD(P)-dependent alcohol dehydrogenase [Alphaproteobacteria bacterium]
MHAAFTPTYGPAHVLELRELPEPVLADDQVLIEVHAAHVHQGDLRLRAADFPGVSAPFGRLMMGVTRPKRSVQGTMFAGRVVAVGASVTRFEVGDDVFGAAPAGAWAERIAVAEDSGLAHRPEGISAAQAAASQYGAGTALHFLRTVADVQPGERVLILGGSGGVGRFAIQVARHLGAHVTAAGSADTLGLMQRLGAHEVVDYKAQDPLDGTFDVILDIADATGFGRARHSLADGGRYLTLFISLGVFAWMTAARLLGSQRALFGIAPDGREAVEAVRDGLAEGWLSPVLTARFPLDEIVAAHLQAAAARHGDVVVEPVAQPAVRVVA